MIKDSRSSKPCVAPVARSDRVVKLPPPPLQGWISKEGGAVRRSFSGRYFVLTSSPVSSVLVYYLKKPPVGEEVGGKVNERGRINLSGSIFSQGTAHSTVASRQNKKRFILDLKSCSEGEKWANALTEHIAYANNQQSIFDKLREGESISSFKEMRL